MRTTAWKEGDPCQECGENGSWDDPIAHFWDEFNQEYRMAHGECGFDAGFELA